MYRNNTQIIHKATEKMNRGELKVDDILDDDDLVNDVKTSLSQLANLYLFY